MIDEPGLERTVGVSETQKPERDEEHAEDASAPDADGAQGTAAAREGRTRQDPDREQRQAGPDSEHEHEQGDVTEILAAAGEGHGGAQCGTYTRGPHDAEQRPARELTPETRA